MVPLMALMLLMGLLSRPLLTRDASRRSTRCWPRTHAAQSRRLEASLELLSHPGPRNAGRARSLTGTHAISDDKPL